MKIITNLMYIVMLLRETIVDQLVRNYAKDQGIIISSEARIAKISSLDGNHYMAKGKIYPAWSYKGTLEGREVMIVVPIDDETDNFVTHLVVDLIKKKRNTPDFLSNGKKLYLAEETKHTYEAVEKGLEIDYAWYDLLKNDHGIVLKEMVTNEA